MAGKDSASRRLARAFRIAVPDTAWAVIAVDDEKNRQLIKWEDMDVDSIAAPAYRNIFTLTSDPSDAPLALAFAAAKLHSNDPTHWRVLLEFFAWAHYGDRKGRGAPKKWDSVRLSQLRKDFSDVKSRNQYFSDNDVFRNLGRRPAYQTKRGPLSMYRFKKLFKDANDPKHNKLLGTIQKIEPIPNFRLKKPK
jgi:hypothetical protein